MSQAATDVRPTTPSRAVHPAVRLVQLRKNYGRVVAADGVDREIAEGEFFTLLRPSGSGKTTLLRLIAGFEREHCLSGLRPVPAHDGDRERRVRVEDPQGPKAGATTPGRAGAGYGPAFRARWP